MKKFNRNFYILIAFYLIYYMSYGLFNPYLNIYFEHLGFSGTQIGQINALAQIASMFLTPLWGILCDKTRRYKSLMGLSILITVVMTYFWSKQTIYSMVLIFSVCLIGIRSCTMPISDSLSVIYCNENHQDYGILRSIGSLGYVLGSVVISKIAAMFGKEGPFVFLYLIALGISLVIVFPYPKVKMVKEESHHKETSFTNMKELMKNKDYLFVLILAVFTNIIMDSAGNYIGNHFVSTMGLSSNALSSYLLVAVIPEIFFILIISRLFRRFGYKRIYLLAGISQCIRGVVYAITSSFPIFLIISFCHMFMTGIGAVGHIQLINRAVPTRYVTTAMTFYMSFYMIISSIFTQLFGIVYDYFGSRYIFLILAIMSFISVFFILMTSQLDK